MTDPDSTTLEERIAKLKKILRTVTIDGAVYYIAEGDLLLSEAQLPGYAAQRPHPDDVKATDAPRLLGILDGGRIVRWKPGLELTYRIDRASFKDDEYSLIRANMKQATADWEAVCGVKFRHLVELDTATGSAPALFQVRKMVLEDNLIALAFFPNDPPERRQLIVAPSYFSPNLAFNKTGVLRHELGHVLGFRHEHIRSGAPAVCRDEELGVTVDLTRYDPQSVMHYFCGGVGSKELELTDIDREGAQRVYGPPLSHFTMVG